MRRWFLIVAVGLLVTGAVPVSAADGDFECDGQVATIVGTEGDDELVGTDEADVIVGLGGNDVIAAGTGHDVVCGGIGDDEIMGGAGRDVLLGGEGADALFGNHGRDRLEGGPGDDTLRGGLGHDSLEGGEGDDLIVGGYGNDHIWPGSGNDVAYGGRGEDGLNESAYFPQPNIGDGADRFYGGPDPDLFILRYHEGLGDSVMFGQDGNDGFSFVGGIVDTCLLAGVTIRLVGREGNDRFFPAALARYRSCAEIIMKGGPGNRDIFDVGALGRPMVVDLERRIAKVRQWPWSQRFHLLGIEYVTTGSGDDLVVGNEKNNRVETIGGMDEVHGRGGDDVIYGGVDDDKLYGNAGDDNIYGGTGTDDLDGGDGTDTCINGETYVSCELPL